MAIDKTPLKIKQLRANCDKFKAKVSIYQADSTMILDDSKSESAILDGPPFRSESFDKILLDAPCSALGKRPQLCNKTSEKVIKSFVPLQRKLLQNVLLFLKHSVDFYLNSSYFLGGAFIDGKRSSCVQYLHDY